MYKNDNIQRDILEAGWMGSIAFLFSGIDPIVIKFGMFVTHSMLLLKMGQMSWNKKICFSVGRITRYYRPGSFLWREDHRPHKL